MNAETLQTVITTSLNEALNGEECSPGQAIAILEIAKLDVYLQMKRVEAEKKRKMIIRPGGLG